MPLNEQLSTIGVKPNVSYFHNTMRIVVLFILLLVLVMVYYSDSKPHTIKATSDDIKKIIKPGTKMYDIVMDMDEDARIVYVSSLGKILKDINEISHMRRILKSVFTALVVTSIVEYITHGSMQKIISVTGKTSLTATLMALT